MIYTEEQIAWATLSGRYKDIYGVMLYDVTHKWDSALGALDYAIALLERVFERGIRLNVTHRMQLMDVVPIYFQREPLPSNLSAQYPRPHHDALLNYAGRPVGQAQY